MNHFVRELSRPVGALLHDRRLLFTLEALQFLVCGTCERGRFPAAPDRRWRFVRYSVRGRHTSALLPEAFWHRK